MPVSDSSTEVALPSPPPIGPTVRPPPLRKANSANNQGPDTNAASLWDEPLATVDLDEESSAAANSSPISNQASHENLWDQPLAIVDLDEPLPPVAQPSPIGNAAALPEPPLGLRSLDPQSDRREAPSPPADERPGRSSDKDKSPETQSSAAETEPEDDRDFDERPSRHLSGLRSAAAFFGSMTIHMAGLIAASLVMFTLPAQPKPVVFEVNPHPEPDERVDTLELDASVTAATKFTTSGSVLTSTAQNSGEPVIGAAGSRLGVVSEIALDKTAVAMAEATSDILVESPLAFAPSKRRLVAAAPDGALGDARAVVDGYDQAFDRITQEVLWMLSKRDVLLVWCFDQSESMKDDQQEIRDRVDRVYTELGLSSLSKGEHLASAVTSFGQGFAVHTPQPTGNARELRSAIEAVPVDPSGKEMMCQAVGASILYYQKIARAQSRQMALILVTDESGERDNNVQFLEPAIAATKAADCRIYVLGREAVFGYPYAHMRWVHPQTHREHWLQIDRGPETAFVEQLQTEGFGRRYDSFNSGFGPYEQTRLARETGGVFFMLPSTETKLVRDGEKRRYELEAMRSYRPDLRARGELIAERGKSPLKTIVYDVITALDPYRPDVAGFMEVSMNFPPAGPAFLEHARTEETKAKQYLFHLDQAAKILEAARRYREQENSPRWQANYDLVYAQILAYAARTYEYGAAVDAFIAKPKVVPLTKPGQMELAGWHVRGSRKTSAGEITKPYIDRSAAMFRRIIEEHPGTPWAARAEWELDRGFGFELVEHYHYIGPRPAQPPSRQSEPRIPIPNL